jgi:hypothetical protein
MKNATLVAESVVSQVEIFDGALCFAEQTDYAKASSVEEKRFL